MADKFLNITGGAIQEKEANHAALAGVSADQHHGQDHQARHRAGGEDALSGYLDANARVAVRKNSGGSDAGLRRRLNLIEGSNVTLTIGDDGTDEEIDITIAASSGGGDNDVWFMM
jgi:hypothetical protein